MKILYFFTKNYPFGESEQYIVQEANYLSETFDMVVVIPGEYFGANNSTQRTMPDNFIVLNLNNELKKLNKSYKIDVWMSIKIMLSEFLFDSNKLRFLRDFKRTWGIFMHQYAASYVIREHFFRYPDAEKYCYSYWLHNSAILLSILKKKNVINNFVSRAHSVDLYHNDWPLFTNRINNVLPFQKFKTLTASKIYSISKTGEKYLKNKFPVAASNIDTSYLGVSIQPVQGLPASGFTIVSCSNMNKHKRVTLIAKIIREIKFNVHWIHFGDGIEKADVELLLSDCKSNITFELRGFIPNDKIIEFYSKNKIHLFVNLSTMEGIPVSVMEAMSFGIPVLATDVFGNKEIVNHSNGFLVSSNPSVDECLTEINRLYSNVLLQEQLSSGARAYVEKNFNAGVNYPNFSNNLLKYKS